MHAMQQMAFDAVFNLLAVLYDLRSDMQCQVPLPV